MGRGERGFGKGSFGNGERLGVVMVMVGLEEMEIHGGEEDDL